MSKQVSIVQSDIKVGTPAQETLIALGKPNIETVDSKGRKVWVYDSLKNIVTYNNSGFGVTTGGIGGGWDSEKFTGIYSSDIDSLKTNLTVVIKFDSNDNIEYITYQIN